jgi:hypothetical protein
MAGLGRRLPRRQLNPALVTAVQKSPFPSWDLAKRAGFPLPCNLSQLIYSVYVTASPRTVNRIKLLASLVGFPPDDVFLPGDWTR